MPTIDPPIKPLRQFVVAATGLVDKLHSERRLLNALGSALAALVLRDDWLPPGCALLRANEPSEHLLYADPARRFSVVSVVLGPGQCTPLQRATVWEVSAGLRGVRRIEAHGRMPDGLRPLGEPADWRPCQVEAVPARMARIRRVRNLMNDGVSIGIHVRGVGAGVPAHDVFAECGDALPHPPQAGSTRPPNLWSLV